MHVGGWNGEINGVGGWMGGWDGYLARGIGDDADVVDGRVVHNQGAAQGVLVRAREGTAAVDAETRGAGPGEVLFVWVWWVGGWVGCGFGGEVGCCGWWEGGWVDMQDMRT